MDLHILLIIILIEFFLGITNIHMYQKAFYSTNYFELRSFIYLSISTNIIVTSYDANSTAYLHLSESYVDNLTIQKPSLLSLLTSRNKTYPSFKMFVFLNFFLIQFNS